MHITARFSNELHWSTKTKTTTTRSTHSDATFENKRGCMYRTRFRCFGPISLINKLQKLINNTDMEINLQMSTDTNKIKIGKVL